MNLQVQDALKDAMGLIGTIEMDETPSNSEMETALRVANIMLGSWSSNRLLLRSPQTVNIPMVPGKATYTVGSIGADITSPKPIKIISGFYRDTLNRDESVSIIPPAQYNSIELKSTSGDPDYISYDPGSEQQTPHYGTISVYPTPDSAGTLIVKVDQYITELSKLTDTLTLEPAYYEAFIYGVAVRLFRHFRHQGDIPRDIIDIANNSLQALRTMNSVPMSSKSDWGNKSKYNVYTDGY